MAKANSTQENGGSLASGATTLTSVLVFDGQDDCVDLGTQPQFKIQKTLTLELWVYIESQRSWAGLVSKVFDTGATESGYGLLLDGNSGVYFGAKVPSQGIEYLSSGANTVPLKEWHHIAGTYDGEQLRVYVDGVEKAAQTLVDSTIHHDPDNNLRMGVYQDNNEMHAFHGKLSEVRLWELVRSQTEIQATMGCRLTGAESGLVGYWPLNEGDGAIAQDKTANHNSGTISGATWEEAQVPFTEASSVVQAWEETTPSVTLAFDGDDYVEIQEPFNNNSEFTIELWLKPFIINDGWRGFIGKQGDQYRKPGLWICPSDNGLHYDSYSLEGERFGELISGFFIAPNEWVHIAWIKQGQEYRFYRDGELFATKPAPENFYTAKSSYWIGRVDNFFTGEMTDVRIWSRARTQAEIQASMRYRLTNVQPGLVGYWPIVEGSGTTLNDYTISANHGSIHGASWVESALPILKQLEAAGSSVQGTPFSEQTAASDSNRVLQFDGEDDYVAVEVEDWETSAFSMEAWVKAATVSQKPYSAFFSNCDGATPKGSFQLDILRGNYRFLHSNISLQFGEVREEWQHLAVTYDGSQVITYVNGEIANQKKKALTICFKDYIFGRNRNQNRFFKGELRDVRIWNRVRTQAELQADRSRPPTGNEPGLIAYFPLNEGSGDIVNDATGNANPGTLHGATWTTTTTPDVSITAPVTPSQPTTTTPITMTPQPTTAPSPPVLSGRQFVLKFGQNHESVALGGGILSSHPRFTLEAWICPSSVSGQHVILAAGAALFYLEGGELKFRASATTDPVASSNAGLAVDTWYHVAVVRGGSQSGDTKLYINGEQNDNQAAVPAIAAGGDTYLGGHPDGFDGQFQGYLTEVRVWRFARSQAEIQANMSYHLTGKELGLIHYWALNEGLGTHIYDKTTSRSMGELSGNITWEAVEVPIKLKLDPEERLTRSTGLEDYGFWFKEIAKQYKAKTEADPPFRRGRIWR